MRADSDSTPMSGPADTEGASSPPATARPSTPSVRPAASQYRARPSTAARSAAIACLALVQERLDGGHEISAIADHGPALANDGPRHGIPAGPRPEQHVVIPGRPRLVGEVA